MNEVISFIAIFLIVLGGGGLLFYKICKLPVDEDGNILWKEDE